MLQNKNTTGFFQTETRQLFMAAETSGPKNVQAMFEQQAETETGAQTNEKLEKIKIGDKVLEAGKIEKDDLQKVIERIKKSAAATLSDVYKKVGLNAIDSDAVGSQQASAAEQARIANFVNGVDLQARALIEKSGENFDVQKYFKNYLNVFSKFENAYQKGSVSDFKDGLGLLEEAGINLTDIQIGADKIPTGIDANLKTLLTSHNVTFGQNGDASYFEMNGERISCGRGFKDIQPIIDPSSGDKKTVIGFSILDGDGDMLSVVKGEDGKLKRQFVDQDKYLDSAKKLAGDVINATDGKYAKFEKDGKLQFDKIAVAFGAMAALLVFNALGGAVNSTNWGKQEKAEPQSNTENTWNNPDKEGTPIEIPKAIQEEVDEIFKDVDLTTQNDTERKTSLKEIYEAINASGNKETAGFKEAVKKGMADAFQLPDGADGKEAFLRAKVNYKKGEIHFDFDEPNTNNHLNSLAISNDGKIILETDSEEGFMNTMKDIGGNAIDGTQNVLSWMTFGFIPEAKKEASIASSTTPEKTSDIATIKELLAEHGIILRKITNATDTNKQTPPPKQTDNNTPDILNSLGDGAKAAGGFLLSPFGLLAQKLGLIDEKKELLSQPNQATPAVTKEVQQAAEQNKPRLLVIQNRLLQIDKSLLSNTTSEESRNNLITERDKLYKEYNALLGDPLYQAPEAINNEPIQTNSNVQVDLSVLDDIPAEGTPTIPQQNEREHPTPKVLSLSDTIVQLRGLNDGMANNIITNLSIFNTNQNKNIQVEVDTTRMSDLWGTTNDIKFALNPELIPDSFANVSKEENQTKVRLLGEALKTGKNIIIYSNSQITIDGKLWKPVATQNKNIVGLSAGASQWQEFGDAPIQIPQKISEIANDFRDEKVLKRKEALAKALWKGCFQDPEQCEILNITLSGNEKELTDALKPILKEKKLSFKKYEAFGIFHTNEGITLTVTKEGIQYKKGINESFILSTKQAQLNDWSALEKPQEVVAWNKTFSEALGKYNTIYGIGKEQQYKGPSQEFISILQKGLESGIDLSAHVKEIKGAIVSVNTHGLGVGKADLASISAQEIKIQVPLQKLFKEERDKNSNAMKDSSFQIVIRKNQLTVEGNFSTGSFQQKVSAPLNDITKNEVKTTIEKVVEHVIGTEIKQLTKEASSQEITKTLQKNPENQQQKLSYLVESDILEQTSVYGALENLTQEQKAWLVEQATDTTRTWFNERGVTNIATIFDKNFKSNNKEVTNQRITILNKLQAYTKGENTIIAISGRNIVKVFDVSTQIETFQTIEIEQLKKADKIPSQAQAELLSMQINGVRLQNGRQTEIDPYLEVKNLTEINPTKLQAIKDQTEWYRVSGAGMGNKVTYASKNPWKNRTENMKVFPEVQNAIEFVSQKLNDKLHENGLDNKFQVQLVVTSLLRTPEKNDRLNGASDNSAHLYGAAFDLSTSRFNIIDKSNGTVFEGHSKNASKTVNKIWGVLSSTLKEIDLPRGSKDYKNHPILVNKETKPYPHLHIVALGIGSQEKKRS